MRRRAEAPDPGERTLQEHARQWAAELFRKEPGVRSLLIQHAYNRLGSRRTKQRDKQRAFEAQQRERDALHAKLLPSVRELLAGGDVDGARDAVRSAPAPGDLPLLIWCEDETEATAALEACLRLSEICYDWDQLSGVLWLRTWYDSSHPY